MLYWAHKETKSEAEKEKWSIEQTRVLNLEAIRTKVQTCKKMQNRKLERLKHLHVLFQSLDYYMYAVITAIVA